MTNENLRLILQAFPYIIKNKGSELAIRSAINLFLKMNGIKTGANLTVVNSSVGTTGFKPYSINIGLQTTPTDTQVLTEILNYVAPSSYIVNYYFYTENEIPTSIFKFNQNIKAVYSNDYFSCFIMSQNEFTTSGANDKISPAMRLLQGMFTACEKGYFNDEHTAFYRDKNLT